MTAQNAVLNEFRSSSPDPPYGWKILHLDLSRIEAVSLEPGYQGSYLYFWHEGRPMGHYELADELPLSETQVRNLAALVIAPAVKAWLSRYDPGETCPVQPGGTPLLSRLSSYWRRETGSSAPQDVSLVICTRDRPERLEGCLRSIAALSFQPSEILVVDNCSRNGDTRRVASQFARVRYIVEPRAGLSRARNAGVRSSSAPLIAFTNDDIRVCPDWLRHLAGALRDPMVHAASGLVLPAELRTKAQILFEQGFGGFSQGYEPRLYGPDFISRSRHIAAPVWSICARGQHDCAENSVRIRGVVR
jgi:hypothetical protein